MTVVAGIDEAGLGPVLGPLVVSATAFSLPAQKAETSLWKLLSSAVSHRPAKRSPRVAFADSKKLYNPQRPEGILHLERGVLAMLASGGQLPATLNDLLAAVAPSAVGQTSRYPWYAGMNLPLPRRSTADGLRLVGNALGSAMDASEVSRPLMLRSEVIFEGEFNRLIQATDNKSVTLFDVTSRLIAALWTSCADPDLRLFVDRQGGRSHYLPALQRLFEGCQFKVLDETDTISGYRLTAAKGTMEVWFLTKAEDRHLPVALASMLSKYLRELFMELFNAYWRQQVPGVAPTAGYYCDGNRFYGEIQARAQAMGIDSAMLYRVR